MVRRPSAPPPRASGRGGGARAGFSLVELMIAMAIGTVVVAGLYNLFSMQARQFVGQDLQMEMHQNGRLALDVLARSGANAGYGTSGRTLGAFGYSGSASSALAMPAVISFDGLGTNGTDAVTMVSMDPSLLMTTQSGAIPDCATTSLYFDMSRSLHRDRLSQFETDQLVMCVDYTAPDGTSSYLWNVTGDPDLSSGTLPIEDGPGTWLDFADRCPVGDNLPPNLSCSRAEVITFYVDATADGVGPGSPDHPTLMMDLDFESPDADDVPVVDDVEDFQVQYCLVGSTCTDPTAWVDEIDTYANTLEDDDADDVQMMRFVVVTRSRREEPARLMSSQPVAVANNTVPGAADHYLREVFQTEVMVRNMRILHL